MSTTSRAGRGCEHRSHRSCSDLHDGRAADVHDLDHAAVGVRRHGRSAPRGRAAHALRMGPARAAGSDDGPFGQRLRGRSDPRSGVRSHSDDQQPTPITTDLQAAINDTIAALDHLERAVKVHPGDDPRLLGLIRGVKDAVRVVADPHRVAIGGSVRARGRSRTAGTSAPARSTVAARGERRREGCR